MVPDKLPVPVLQNPHWRVTYRPATYEETRLRTLSECLEIVKKNRVQLRGWDFPHIPPREQQMAYGTRWIAAWSDFMDHLEYWRYYQSTQFLYLGSVREFTNKEWAERQREAARFDNVPDVSSIPGFLSIPNFIYTVTEIFEFAARLAQAAVYENLVTIDVGVRGVKGFVLTADPDRFWTHAYAASESDLNFQRTISPADLVASAAEAAVACTVWFFERFGWLKPNIHGIRSDQQKLLTRSL